MLTLVLFAGVTSCSKDEELSLDEIESASDKNSLKLLKKTVSKPYTDQKYVAGKVNGVWNDTLLEDPKTFNIFIGERDETSSALVAKMQDYLVDYDNYTRTWKPRCASFEIETDDVAGTLTVHYTLRNDMYWSYYGSDKKIPVTADDVVWWYNEVWGDPKFQSMGYSGEFVTMSDGSEKHIDCVKTGTYTFDFKFPRIVADPLLDTNTNLTPSFVYKAAKEKGGVQAVEDLFNVSCDVKTIPSCGQWFLTEYTPGQRVVYERNPNYWRKDDKNVSIPHIEKQIFQIVGDENTDYLLFKKGQTEAYGPKPEQLDEVIANAKKAYTVYNAEGSYGASFWSFNQNPKNKDSRYYSWFTKKEFRQAMSCLLNRDRIVSQVYRGLAEPKYDFFPEVNPYYNPAITLKYRYSVAEAEKLLQQCGFKKNSAGVLVDEKNVPVEFDLAITATSTMQNDIAQIIADECSKVGVKVNVRQTDFQKIVDTLTKTFDWQSVIIGLGTNKFPSQGSNVWPSDGNLHVWYPYQEKPATDWEARVDYLYNEGCYTIDHDKAQRLWDEENKIILEQCPIIYLVQARSFFALNNRWSQTNFYFDNKNGSDTEYIFLK